MAIWLGRNYLGQREEMAIEAGINIKEDGLSRSLKELANKLENDED